MAQAKFQRVFTRLGCHQVDMQVPRINIGVGGRSPPRADSERMNARADHPFPIDRFSVMRDFVEIFATPAAGEVHLVIQNTMRPAPSIPDLIFTTAAGLKVS